MTESRYRIGRAMAGIIIGLGWACAVIAVVVTFAGAWKEKGNPVLAAVVVSVAAGVAALLNHGFWQLAFAIFDIADQSREHLLTQQQQLEHLSALRRGPRPAAPPATPIRPAPTEGEVWAPQPAHQQEPLPPVQLPNGPRPGETDEQWAKRIEKEEAAAFQKRHR